ncbi:MAG: hypothetical protein ABSD31_17610 [Candidatus Binataceae bacterium]
MRRKPVQVNPFMAILTPAEVGLLEGTCTSMGLIAYGAALSRDEGLPESSAMAGEDRIVDPKRDAALIATAKTPDDAARKAKYLQVIAYVLHRAYADDSAMKPAEYMLKVRTECYASLKPTAAHATEPTPGQQQGKQGANRDQPTEAERAIKTFADAAHQQREQAEKATDPKLGRQYSISYYAYMLAMCAEAERTRFATNAGIMELCPKVRAQIDGLDDDTKTAVKSQELSLLLSTLK